MKWLVECVDLVNRIHKSRQFDRGGKLLEKIFHVLLDHSLCRGVVRLVLTRVNLVADVLGLVAHGLHRVFLDLIQVC